MRSALAGLTVVIAMLAATPVRAQEESARVLFERGYEALLDGRFPEARDLLRASLERERRVATAFNLVLALLGTEAPVEAGRVCGELLEGAYGTVGRSHRREVERECARAEAEAATLIVEVEGGASAELRLDGGEPRPAGSGLVTLDVDPGAHVVEASDEGRSVQSRVTLGRGQTSRIVLRIPPPLAAGDGETGEEESASGTPWWLIGVGGAVVVGGVLAAILLVSVGDGGGPTEPIRDPVFGVITALR